MAATTCPFEDLVRNADSRAALAPLLAALGFRPLLDTVPRGAWAAYGLEDGAPVDDLVVAGRAGTLEALLVELSSGAPADAHASVAAAVRRRNGARLHLFVFAGSGYRRLALATYGVGDELRQMELDREELRRSDLDALTEMAPTAGETGLELALRQGRALDRARVAHRFFKEFRAHRDTVAAAWSGPPREAEGDRRQLALLFLSRLTFLAFLERRRLLAGDDLYLVHLFARDAAAPSPGERAARAPLAATTFYRRRLIPLFFDALNRKLEVRTAAARELGPLPYLNGGLFERHALEDAYPELDLADAIVEVVLVGLLERFRFTAREAADGAAFGVDPEMLGRVFEELMEADRRGETGSFYTPGPVVQRVVREGLAEYLAGACPDVDPQVFSAGSVLPAPDQRYRLRRALERVRVLDPACGSGAFLLGALHHLARLLAAVSGRPDGEVRRRIVASSLHGVDLLDEAALLCSLRLWLALSDDHEVRPLPNLDRRIRQGDALVDPLDLGPPVTESDLTGTLLRDPALRRALRAVPAAARRYLDSGPDERADARDALARCEIELARRWVDGLRDREAALLRDLDARSADRDLFGERPPDARRAARARRRAAERRRELHGLARAIEDSGAVPFFSFGVHFAEAARGFDLIVSNPPWVRSHRWPQRVRRLASSRYEVCRNAGWSGATDLTGFPAGAGSQVDLSLLFVERSLRLLAPGGVLAVLLPAKALRALYGGGLRRMLLRDLEFAMIEDHALDQRSIFRADAFAAVFIARRPAVGDPAVRPARIRLVRRGVEPLEFRLSQRELPLFPGDAASPWILAPPAVQRAMRGMQASGEPLGRHPELRVRRGIMTGANRELVLVRVEPKLAGLARVEAEGHRATRRSGGSARAAARYRAYVELAAVRPLVRGADIDAFTWRTERYVIWCHDGQGRPAPAGSRMSRYLDRHRDVLERRPGWRPGLPLGVVSRLSPDTLRPKVAWHDLSDTLRAVALPDRTALEGRSVELVPLNTVYFLPVPDAREALLLAGLLNSLPVRTFARAIAERAKDARFRFFAWTVSCVPLPRGWRQGVASDRIADLSRAAHVRGGITPDDQAALDAAAAALYGLAGPEVEALVAFDAWLRGRP